MQKYKVHVKMTMELLVDANSPEEAEQEFYENIAIDDDIETTVDTFNVSIAKQE